MGLTGIEPNSVTDSGSIDLQQSSESGAAESGAVGPDSCQIDSRLQVIIDAWPSLSDESKSEIESIIESTTDEE